MGSSTKFRENPSSNLVIFKKQYSTDADKERHCQTEYCIL